MSLHVRRATFRHLTTPLSPRRSITNGASWLGRHPDEHAVNRSEHDVQSQPSHAAMREKDKHLAGEGDKHGEEDNRSQGISEKDHGENNKRAKEEISPEAPGPVIGMNDERGGKGH